MLTGIGTYLAGCASSKFASVEKLCEELPPQEYAVFGKTPHDQPWIDDTSEALIAACDRQRPKPRPAEWDAPPSKVPLLTTKPAAVKKSWWRAQRR